MGRAGIFIKSALMLVAGWSTVSVGVCGDARANVGSICDTLLQQEVDPKQERHAAFQHTSQLSQNQKQWDNARWSQFTQQLNRPSVLHSRARILDTIEAYLLGLGVQIERVQMPYTRRTALRLAAFKDSSGLDLQQLGALQHYPIVIEPEATPRSLRGVSRRLNATLRALLEDAYFLPDGIRVGIASARRLVGGELDSKVFHELVHAEFEQRESSGRLSVLRGELIADEGRSISPLAASRDFIYRQYVSFEELDATTSELLLMVHAAVRSNGGFQSDDEEYRRVEVLLRHLDLFALQWSEFFERLGARLDDPRFQKRSVSFETIAAGFGVTHLLTQAVVRLDRTTLILPLEVFRADQASELATIDDRLRRIRAHLEELSAVVGKMDTGVSKIHELMLELRSESLNDSERRIVFQRLLDESLALQTRIASLR